MSPIDDELRTALQRRATALAPSPDPLAGIERRASRLRRNRLAASVAGSVLAVAAVATAVPLLTGSPATDPPPVAVTQPTADPSGSPSPGVATTSYALDPAAPWPYRGTPVEGLGDQFVDTVTREYAARFGGAAVSLEPLWGQVHGPSGQSEAVFLADVDGQRRWGFVRSSESGPEFLVDEPLPQPALALAAAVPGDEVARLVVVTSPAARAAEYFPDERAEDATPLAELADGVATGPLGGDRATDSLLVRTADGRELWRGPAPDPADADPSSDGTPAGDALPPPGNVVDWPLRGSVPDELAEQATAAFADAAGVSRDEVTTRLLYGGSRDGTAYVLLQGWYGSDARAFAYAREQGTGASTSALQPATSPGPAVLAALVDGVLLVVPEPRAGQVLYAPDGTAEPEPVPDQGTEVAVLVERSPDAVDDRLLVLDGDGDPEQPIYRGPVADLLAAS